MKIKNRLLFRFAFLLVVCSLFIVPNISAAENSEKDFNIPIYIQTSAGIEKADSKIIKDALINYNFDIQEKFGYAPDDKCSVRADGGSLNIDEMSLENIDLSFYIPSANGGLGEGSLTAQEGRNNYFSLGFEVTEILEINAQTLKFEAIGDGALNQNPLGFDDIVVTFDKTNKKVEIEASGDMDFEAKDIEVSKMTWCGGEETNFYLIILKNSLGQQRSVEEIRSILEEHPELIDAYEGLREFYKPQFYTPVIIPEFSTFIGILTLVGAVGIFFFVRRK